MTYIAKPKLHHPQLPANKLGFTRRDYEGAISTLCAGCGHDSISAAIIQACFELDLPPHRIAKLSGIGCSSKTPTYFLGNSHGFNSVHGRMPSVLTGANLANRELIYLGVSGDGDSASIGLGQFAHSVRRGVNMVYIVEKQRRVRADQGPVLGDFGPRLEEQERRGQYRCRDRHGLAGNGVGRHVRSAQLLRRQGATGAADQGCDPALRGRVHRLHLTVRGVQQPSRLDQELRLRARAQRSGQPARRHAAARADHGGLCNPAKSRKSPSTTARC